MASSGNALSVAHPLIPVFKGESYEFWSIRMKTIPKSQDLWDLVERGFADPDEENTLRNSKKKDAKALVFIQQAVYDSHFSRIVAATTSKKAWSILQKEFQGDSKVIVVRLQSLRHDFETLMMKNGESIADLLSRAVEIVSKIRSCGEKVTDQMIVEKILRSLTPKFDHARLNRSIENNEDKAFQVKEATTKYGENNGPASRGRGRGGFRSGRGRGYGRGRGRNDGHRQSNEQSTKSLFQELDEKQKKCHDPSLYPGHGRHSRTIAGPQVNPHPG
ncbi:hypothetical protein KY289_030738 [Solanum tuberosum]|nr:hypothetical protein KY289_030738 [Solanum tuberosum]